MRAVLIVLLLGGLAAGGAPDVEAEEYTLSNDLVRASFLFTDGRLAGERLKIPSSGAGPSMESDAGFTVELVWNGWRAPGKANNGDIFCVLGPSDFILKGSEKRSDDAGQEWSLFFDGPAHLGLELTVRLANGTRSLRRRLRVFERVHRLPYSKREGNSGHLLHALYPYDARLSGNPRVIKAGGFGQPVAFALEGGGAFAGLEWPAADNALIPEEQGVRLRCGQEIGERVDSEGVTGEWAVLALTPDSRVKEWFVRYLDEIRAAPLRPYALYNTWYDLRSAEYPRVEPRQVMNEENVLRIARLLRENMVERHGITLDAFVLDDGWDVYESDWRLRPVQFPTGLEPIRRELARTGTALGIWFGPTGGYSFHGMRADWFRSNGYEVTDNNMISLVGRRYAELFRRRVTEMSRAGATYFKWDGIQFVDNNPENGGPVGIYGRRAALRHLIACCESVRAVHPQTFLNITSGTWLSPWWLRWANTIWMDGGDFGSAEVPSISTRDSSITYRDVVLYEDFHRKGLWFPVANLMTHGILKGHIDIEDIGRGEPLGKFADEVVFYLARGVSMYELYIAPDILSEGEWAVLADSLRWARMNFDVLKRGEMTGGDPGKGEPYAHVHFNGSRGLLAVRNPVADPAVLDLRLDPAHGLEPAARNLLLERIYPTRWVAPDFYAAGDKVRISLHGFEAAIYELRPVEDLAGPLPVDAVFEADADGIRLLEVGKRPGVVGPGRFKRGGKDCPPSAWAALTAPPTLIAAGVSVNPLESGLEVEFSLDGSARRATLGFLILPGREGEPDPSLKVESDGRAVETGRVSQPGKWHWLTVEVGPGKHRLFLAAKKNASSAEKWTGRAEVWLSGLQSVTGAELKVAGDEREIRRPLPPSGRGGGVVPRVLRLGSVWSVLGPDHQEQGSGRPPQGCPDSSGPQGRFGRDQEEALTKRERPGSDLRTG